jgi:ABC-2 type transport system permease protein
MFKELYFALYAVKKNIVSSAELRTSFLMNVIGMTINNTAFIFLWIFFVQSVGVINGWTGADIVGLQGFTALSYGIVFSVAMGIRKLPDYIASGAFDRFMLSPKNILLRVATSAFSPSAVGDIVFGITCLSIYAVLIHAGFLQVLLGILLVLCSTIIFLAGTIIIFSTSFYFVDAHNVSSGLFEIFLTPAMFHGGAFQGITRFVYTFLIPSLLVGSLPVEIVRDASLSGVLFVALLTMIWLLLAIVVFNEAVRRYESSNFMTFGN